jgi:hypothetical protein
LHNLGELCALLRYSLDSVAFEVNILSNAWKWELPL